MTTQSAVKHIEHATPSWQARKILPTMYDLPSENPEEPGVPDQFHSCQSNLLTTTFTTSEYPPERIMTAADLNLYYDVNNTGYYKRPDWYAVLDVPRFYDERDMRSSYVIWQEEVAPFIVVELLSPGTEKEDLGRTLRRTNTPPTKWEVYEKILGIPYYVVFSRYTNEFLAFGLARERYCKINLPDNRLWLPELKLFLGLWHGNYKGAERMWLRWFDAGGKMIPTSDERAEQEKQRTEQEKQRAEQEKQRAEQEKERAEQEKQRADREKAEKKNAQYQLLEERKRTEMLLEKLKMAGIDPNV